MIVYICEDCEFEFEIDHDGICPECEGNISGYDSEERPYDTLEEKYL